MTQATLEIQNLKCGGCANTIISRLNELDNISDVTVDNTNDSVSFAYQNEDGLQSARTLLSKLGYPVVGENNPLSKKARSFVSCAAGRMQR